MNINKLRKAIRFSLYSCLLAAFGASSMVAQSNEDDNDIHDLSLFTIDATEDTGYVATSTLAGTRIRTDLKDLGSAISVYTTEFMEYTSRNGLRVKL